MSITDTDGGDDLTVKDGPTSPLLSNSSNSFILSLIMDAMISSLVLFPSEEQVDLREFLELFREILLPPPTERVFGVVSLDSSGSETMSLGGGGVFLLLLLEEDDEFDFISV